MRILNSKIMKRVLRTLAAIANDATGAAEKVVHQRIHIAWRPTSVTLSASDGHRSVSVTLYADSTAKPSDQLLSEATIVLPYDVEAQPLLKYDTHTIFKATDGHVKFIGTQLAIDNGTPVTREFGLDAGCAAEAWPIDIIHGHMNDLQHDTHGLHVIELNPEYMTDALTIINSLWELVDTPAAPRTKIIIPGAIERPALFSSTGFDKAGRDIFKADLLVMPYREIK